MATLELVVKDYTELFERAMELRMSLQEDPTLQKIGTDLREKPQQLDEIISIVRTLVLVQWFAKLQEGKQLQNDIDEMHWKQAILMARTQPWREVASQITLLMQSKLKSMQQTQRTMGLIVEGPTTENLVEEVQQEATQGTTDLQVLNLEFHELK